MAVRDLVVFENGKYKRRMSSSETLDFLSIKIGASGLEIKESSGKFDFSAKELANIANASADTSAPGWGQVKDYVASQAVAGGTVKQQLLTQQQLSDTLGIIPGTVVYISANPTANDTITFKDAAGNTEIWTFVASRSGANEVTIGVDAATSMSNLAAAMMLDSSRWDAYYDASQLGSIYPGGLVGVYRVADTDNAFKVWITQTGGTIAGFVANYYQQAEYKSDAAILALGTSEPTNPQSGFSIAKADLSNGEIHNVIAEDKLKAWDGDFNAGAGQWFTMSEGVIPVATAGAGGGTLGKATFDTDYGLTISGIGIARAKVDGSSLEFDPTVGVTKGEIRVKAAGITESHLNASVAGDGLTGGAGTALAVGAGNGISVAADAVAVAADTTGGANLAKAIDVNSNGVAVKVDDSSIEGDATTGQLKVKALGIATGMIADNAVTAAKLNSDVAGDGIVLNGTSNAIEVSPDATGGANLAKAIAVSANGVAVKVDDSSIEGDATTGQLKIKTLGVATGMLADNSVTAAKLNSDTAGAGLALNGTSNALEVTTGDAIQIVSDAVSVDFTKSKTNDNAGAITAGQIVYVKSNGNVDLAQANVAALPDAELGIVAASSIAAAASGAIVFRRGAIVSGFSGLTPGKIQYVSRATAGALTEALTGFVAGEFVYAVGRAISATEIVYAPEFIIEY